MEIDRRRFLELMGGAAASLLAAPGCGTGRAPARPPNLLVIQPDQHRGMTLGCAGDDQALTPNLDRLAAEGTRFSNAVSCCPLCAPFRATMQTGLYWHRHRVLINGMRLDPELTGFAEIFAQHGYATGYIGKWHLYGHRRWEVGGYVPEGPHRQGWQEWHGYETGHRFFDVWRFDEQQREVRVEGYDWEPTWHTDMMLDFAARQREAGRPWLYYLSFGPPHRPEECPQEYLDRFPQEAFRLPPDLDGRLSADDEAELRRIWQVYYGQVAAVDHEVGRIVAGLEQLGIAEDTIILYVGDHGDRLGSHWKAVGGRESNPRGKAVPYATAFRIPLIVRWPGGIEAGQLCDALMPCVDLTPTLLDLAGLQVPEAMQGSSMADWCRRGTGPHREILYLGLGGGPHAWRAVWDGRLLFARGQYRHLYDHREDPHEMNDLLGAQSHRALARELDARLLELARATGDPYVERLEREGPIAL